MRLASKQASTNNIIIFGGNLIDVCTTCSACRVGTVIALSVSPSLSAPPLSHLAMNVMLLPHVATVEDTVCAAIWETLLLIVYDALCSIFMSVLVCHRSLHPRTNRLCSTVYCLLTARFVSVDSRADSQTLVGLKAMTWRTYGHVHYLIGLCNSIHLKTCLNCAIRYTDVLIIPLFLGYPLPTLI